MSAAPPTVAVFDLDGTITWRDTYLAYLLHVLPRRSRRLPRCLGLPGAVLRFKLGRMSNDELKRRFLAAILGGSSRAEIARHTASFVERRLPGLIKPAARARIARHRAAGHRLILATASLDLYAEEVGQRLGFDEVIATRVAWAEEAVAEALDGANLLGEAKLGAVRARLAAHGAEAPRVIAYSDHHSDLPLLLFADEGVAVDPTPRLAAAAARHGLRIESWR